jgi:hypothetical protein
MSSPGATQAGSAMSVATSMSVVNPRSNAHEWENNCDQQEHDLSLV